MGTRLSIRVPGDYLLRRDVCSYGYFLLAPNHWDPGAGVFWTVLDLEGGAARVRIGQGAGGESGKGSPVTARFSRVLSRAEQTEARRLIGRMLRLDEGATVVRAFHRVDPRWRRSGRGRLMRSPTLFEDVIKTVTSCNVTWPSTVTMNERLCEVMGRGVEGGTGRSTRGRGGDGSESRPTKGSFTKDSSTKGRSTKGRPTGVRPRSGSPDELPGHAFPRPQRLARVRPSNLRGRCRVGYRDARIVEMARLFARGEVDEAWLEDPQTPDGEVERFLLDLPGIGPYAAANIMQLLGRYRRLPLDTESLRHGRSVLGYDGTDGQVMTRLRDHYEPFGEHAFRSYWFEMWVFYESKRGPSWTWERRTTGRSFTASLLK